MSIKNKTLLLLTSILTANAFTLNAFAMREMSDNNSMISDNDSVINGINDDNDDFALFNDDEYKKGKPLFYDANNISYKDLMDLYRNKNNEINSGILNESGIVNKNNTRKNAYFIKVLKDNSMCMTKEEYGNFISVMSPTFDKFGISTDWGNIKEFTNESMNSPILNDMINNREFSTNTIMNVILSYYSNKDNKKDNKSEFDNFLIKLKILSLDVNNKFDLFCNLCERYSNDIKLRYNSFHRIFNEIIPALANMILYEVNNANEYNDNTDAIVCNILSTMTQLHKYNHDIDLSELNGNIVKYITSMNYDDNDFNDAQFANNHLAINLMYYYNRTLNGIINSKAFWNSEIDLFNNEYIAEHLKTVSENVIAHYSDINGINSIDQRILTSFSTDDSRVIRSENLIEMGNLINRDLPLVMLLNMVADTNHYNCTQVRNGNFKHFRDEVRNSIKSPSACINNIEDFVNAMLSGEKSIVISKSLWKVLVSEIKYKTHSNYNKQVLEIIGKHMSRWNNQGTCSVDNSSIGKIFLAILQHYGIKDLGQFHYALESKKEIIGKLMTTQRTEEAMNVIEDCLYESFFNRLNRGILFFQKYLNWFVNYSDFSTKHKEHENYSEAKKTIIREIMEKISDEYRDIKNKAGNDHARAVQNIINFYNRYDSDNVDSIKDEIKKCLSEINKEKNEGVTNIISESVKQICERDNFGEFKKYKEINTLLRNILYSCDLTDKFNNEELINVLLNRNNLYDFVFYINSGSAKEIKDFKPMFVNKYDENFKTVKSYILKIVKNNKNFDTQTKQNAVHILCSLVTGLLKDASAFIRTNDKKNELNIKLDSDYTIYNCAKEFIDFVLSHDYESCVKIFEQMNALQFVRIMKMIESDGCNELDEQKYRSYLLQSAVLNAFDEVKNNNMDSLLQALYGNIVVIKKLSKSTEKIEILDNNSNDNIRVLKYLHEVEEITIPKEELNTIRNVCDQFMKGQGDTMAFNRLLEKLTPLNVFIEKPGIKYSKDEYKDKKYKNDGKTNKHKDKNDMNDDEIEANEKGSMIKKLDEISVGELSHLRSEGYFGNSEDPKRFDMEKEGSEDDEYSNS